jgi:hypothetical protein
MYVTRRSPRARNGLLGVIGATAMALSAVMPAAAATTVVVTPSNTHGWFEGEDNNNSSIEYVTDLTAPGGTGALELSTALLPTSAKAQYLHATNTRLLDVTEMSYWTRQIAAPFPAADPSYQLVTCLNGVAGGSCQGFTTLVFEPYQQPTQGAVIPNDWQDWDVDAGQFWSTRTVVCTGGPVAGQGVTAGGGGAPFYMLSYLQTACPNAVVVQFGVNIGSNNPGWTVRTDLFNFNGTTYDFEVTNQPSDKNQCKNGGYVDYTDADGEPFKNQGQCIKAANRAGGGGEE